MTTSETHPGTRDLGDGLRMRPVTPADLPELEAFGTQTFAPRAGVWMRKIAAGETPFCIPADYLVVEDTTTQRIVSSVGLLSQHWTYDGIPLRVGQPEFVLTRSEYRHKGLIRAQMAAVHAISEARGDHLQAITGIPYYYRQFGYEMTVPLGGARIAISDFLPQLKQGESEPYLVRPASREDLSFITELVAVNARRRSLVANVYSEAEWEHVLTGWEGERFRDELAIVTTLAGERIGFVQHNGWIRGMAQLAINTYELVAGMNWLAVTPTIFRYLQSYGEVIAARNRAEAAASPEPVTPEPMTDNQHCRYLNVWLGATHPVYDIFHQSVLSPRNGLSMSPYAWYLRVADLPAFLRHIQPVLAARLAASELAGYTGDLRLGFYRTGLTLTFVDGIMTAIETFRPQSDGDGSGNGDVLFPNLTFLHVLFGHHTVEELRDVYPDCYARKEASRLIHILFPKRPSALQSWSSEG